MLVNGKTITVKQKAKVLGLLIMSSTVLVCILGMIEEIGYDFVYHIIW